MYRCLNISLLVILLLSSCSHQPSPAINENTEAWFTDEDLDNAVLDVAQAKAIVAKEGLETSEVTNQWGEVTKLFASDGAENDLFSSDLAISRDTVAAYAYE